MAAESVTVRTNVTGAPTAPVPADEAVRVAERLPSLPLADPAGGTCTMGAWAPDAAPVAGVGAGLVTTAGAIVVVGTVVVGATVVDDSTVRIEFKDVSAPFLAYVAGGNLAIVSPKATQAQGGPGAGQASGGDGQAKQKKDEGVIDAEYVDVEDKK